MSPEKQLIFFEKVRKMRGWQKEYHKYHVKADLDKAQRFQRDVDIMIGDELKEINSKQLTLIK